MPCIRTKQDFLTLYLIAMHKMGMLVTTCQFQNDLLKMMNLRKYDDLFAFFYNLDDFDFTSELQFFEKKGLISLVPREKEITIRLSHKFCYPVAEQLAEQYDDYLLSLMIQFLRELKLSANLGHFLPYEVDALYCLTNPNAIYTIDGSTSIITDGTVDLLAKTGTYLVQDADFVVLQKMKEEKLAAFELYYRFEDQKYIFHIVNKIITLYGEINHYVHLLPSEHIELHQDFEEFSHVKGYRYKR